MSATSEHDEEFVGREAEIAAIDTAFRRLALLVTLTGPGGIGKTALARRWAVRRAPRNHVWCDVVRAQTADDVLRSIALALDVGVRGTANVADLTRALRARGAEVLVLDAGDGLPSDAAEAIAHLLRIAKPVPILLTSRSPLTLPEEHLIEVPPLRTSRATKPGDDPGSSAPSPAGRMLVTRLRRLRDDAVRTEADLHIVEEIAATLEGIPLALELAAPWIRLMPLQALRERVFEGAASLTSPTGHDARHRSMQAVVESSVESLTENERQALYELSAFVGPFTPQAAAQVLSATGGLTSVLGLRQHSLLHADPHHPDRLAMFGLVRELVAARAPREIAEAARRRHAAYHGDLGARLALECDRGNESSYAELRRNASEIVAAARFVFEQGRDAPATEEALRLLATLREPLSRLSAPPGTAALLEDIARHDASLSPLARAWSLYLRELLGAPPLVDYATYRAALPGTRGDDALRLSFLERIVRMAEQAGDFEPLPEWSEELERLAVALGFTMGAKASVVCAALLDKDGWRPPGADERAQKALARLRSVSPAPRPLASGLVLVASVIVEFGRNAESLALAREIIALSGTLGDARLEANALYATALATLDLGELDRAATEIARASSATRVLGWEFLHTHLLWAAAIVDLVRGDGIGALRTLDASRAARHPALAPLLEALSIRAHLCAGLAAPPSRPAPELFGDVAVAFELETALARTLREGNDADLRAQLAAAVTRAESESPRSHLLRAHLRSMQRELSQLGLARTTTSETWLVSEDGVHVVLPSGSTIHLGGTPVLATVLSALVHARIAEPGKPLGALELVSRAWGGQRMLKRAAHDRVRATIARLRRAGLGALIETTDGGYRIPTTAAVAWMTKRDGGTPRGTR